MLSSAHMSPAQDSRREYFLRDHRTYRLLLLFSCLSLSFRGAACAVINVAPGPGTAQAAHDDATAGDTLVLADGTYTGALIISKSLTVRALNSRKAILDGESSTGPVQLGVDASCGDWTGGLGMPAGCPDHPIVLVGLVITRCVNGMGTSAGLEIGSAYTVKIDDCEITDNNGYMDWGGILVSGTGKQAFGGVEISNSLIAKNRGGFRSGLLGPNPPLAPLVGDDLLILRNNVFIDNTNPGFACHISIQANSLGPGSELYNNTIADPSTWYLGKFLPDPCESGISISVLSKPVIFPCTTLGEWNPPPPIYTGATGFTGCSNLCDPGSFGDRYNLTDAGCTGLCPIGHSCPQGTGLPEPCSLGEYAPAEGMAKCTACPAFSTTSYTGATGLDECQCGEGRFLTTNDAGNPFCQQCADVIASSTTLEAGAKSIDECICTVGFYAKADTSATSGRTCEECDMSVMDCTIAGITIANMPIKPGGWRLSNTTSIVRECFNPDACIGNPGVAGSNATQRRRLSAGASTSTAGDALCAPGHSGFLCGTCVAGWCGAPHAPHAPSPCHFLRARGSTWFTSHMTRTRAEMST